MPGRLEGDFDYIVVGAGTAGCIMANRLSADPKNRVLILEAGGNDNWIWFHIPVGYLFAIGNPRSDWMFKTEPEPGLNGRALAYPRGKVIGGSSAINAMISMRGQAADYDHWRQLGLTGWGYGDVLPLFRRLEDHFLGESEHHGAVGVRFLQGDEVVEARTKGEVVLCAGSIGSTQVLHRSGIGPADWLSPLGIDVVLDRQGVGRNLQDHLQQRAIYKVEGVRTLNETYWSLMRRGLMGLDYAFRRRGPLTMTPSP